MKQPFPSPQRVELRAPVARDEYRVSAPRVKSCGTAWWDAIYLAGVDDVWEEKHDLDRALRGIPREAVTVLLAHEPDFADTVATDGRVGLQLSGHSHGGQVRLPGLGAIRLPPLGVKYPEGLNKVGDMLVYTNRGIGVVTPPIRLNCRPEVTIFEIVAG